LAWYWRN